MLRCSNIAQRGEFCELRQGAGRESCFLVGGQAPAVRMCGSAHVHYPTIGGTCMLYAVQHCCSEARHCEGISAFLLAAASSVGHGSIAWSSLALLHAATRQRPLCIPIKGPVKICWAYTARPLGGSVRKYAKLVPVWLSPTTSTPTVTPCSFPQDMEVGWEIYALPPPDNSVLWVTYVHGTYYQVLHCA
jgi:hypothetical protein